MEIVPLSPVPSQRLSVILGGQNCQLSVYEKSTGVFLDLAIDNAPIISGALCLDRDPLLTAKYLGFIGTLKFADTLGTNDPQSAEFGTRYFLLYIP